MIDNKLRIVAGNTFATAHTITANDVQGQPIPDFDLQQCTDIHVYARNGGNYKQVTSWQTDDQSVVVVWYGKQMKLGGYDFYIAGNFNGIDWRTSEATIFEIVQYNEEANIPADTIVVDGTYFVDASFSLITEIQGGGGGATPSDAQPLMDGTADAGTDTKYSRGDHRHPSDTNKQDVISDLETIRSGAAAGATAVQPAALSGYQPLIDNAHKLDYSLLDNTPTIPAAQVNSDWDAASGVAQILNKPTIPAAGIPAGGNAGQVLTKTDGSTDYAVEWRDTNNIFPSAYCTTAAATAAKGASCTFWTATANSYLHILMTKANSNQGALTLNVNNTGAAPIYINGTVSSSTNYTLPAGSYIVFYDGTNYYFRTDGKLTASITGMADGSANVIETVKVNGTALTPDANKAVNVVTLIPITSHGTSDTTFALTPNVFHEWGTVSSLTLTLATPSDNTVVNLYMFSFVSGSTATNLSLPQSVVWASDNNQTTSPPTIATNMKYEITIKNDCAEYKAFPTS